MDSERLRFLARFICESDAIENIIDDQSVIERQLRAKKKRGHVGALLLLEDLATKKVPLTEEIIKRVQRLIVDEQPKKGQRALHPRHRGRWRDCMVSVGGRLCMKVEHIDLAMRSLVQMINEWQHEDIDAIHPRLHHERFARSHFRFLRIHPFVDGNGRTSRAIVYYLYRFIGQTPPLFTADDKHETYYRCFEDDNGRAMIGYFLSRFAG